MNERICRSRPNGRGWGRTNVGRGLTASGHLLPAGSVCETAFFFSRLADISCLFMREIRHGRLYSVTCRQHWRQVVFLAALILFVGRAQMAGGKAFVSIAEGFAVRFRSVVPGAVNEVFIRCGCFLVCSICVCYVGDFCFALLSKKKCVSPAVAYLYICDVCACGCLSVVVRPRCSAQRRISRSGRFHLHRQPGFPRGRGRCGREGLFFVTAKCVCG